MPVAARASAGIGTIASATRGHTIGASSGVFSIAGIGTVAPSATTFEPDICAQLQTGEPNAV